LRQLPQVELAGACDLNPASRESFTGRWQVPTYAAVDELLSAAQPDMAHILTPPATHAGLATQLLEAGLHVLVEKPMALSVADANRMIATARRTGRVLTVDHNRWFDPVVQRTRALLEGGRLGTLVGVEVFQGAAVGESETPSGQAEHWSAALPGGILFNLAPHPAYLLHGFTGKVRTLQVIADADARGRLREIRALAQGEHAPGALTISLRARPFMNRLTLLGSEASLDVNLNNMTLILRRERKVPKVIGKVLPNLEEAAQLIAATATNTIEFVRGRQRYYPGMGIHFRELYASLAAGQPPPVSAEAGRDGVWLLEEIWTRAGISMAPELRQAVNA